MDIKIENSRLKWTDEMLKILIETLYDQFKLRKHTDSGRFKATTWFLVVEAVQSKMYNKHVIEESSCRNKWQWFKDMWRNWKILEGMSGFGWDEEQELFKADKEIWDGLIKSYKNIKWHKNNVLNHRDILREMLEGAQATGDNAFSMISDEMIDLQLQINSIFTPISSNTIKRSFSKSISSYNQTSDDDIEISNKKPRKIPKIDLGQALINMTDEIRKSREAKQQQKSEKTVQEKAIAILYEDYEYRVIEGVFIEILMIFESENKARIFSSLKAGEKRDRWLEITAGIELFVNQ